MAGSIMIAYDSYLDGESVRDPDGSYRYDTQQGWEQFFAGSGKRLPTVQEYILSLKYLDEQKDPALAGILRDFDEDPSWTGVKIDFRKSNLPFGSGGFLDNLVKDSAWRRALEDELFRYDALEAIDVIQRVSGKQLYIGTPGTSGRKFFPERAVRLDIYADWFNFNCHCDPVNLDGGGRARGVRRGVSISEKEALQGAILEPTLPLMPAINDNENQPELRPLCNPVELAYARRLLDGIPSGTVMDWKKR